MGEFGNLPTIRCAHSISCLINTFLILKYWILGRNESVAAVGHGVLANPSVEVDDFLEELGISVFLLLTILRQLGSVYLFSLEIRWVQEFIISRVLFFPRKFSQKKNKNICKLT